MVARVMKSIWARIKSEPAVVAMLINQGFLLAMAFGFSLEVRQLVEINGLVALVLTVATRQNVVPVSKMTVSEVQTIGARSVAGD